MNIEEIKKFIVEMDVNSDEFFELYRDISKKYYTVENPDTYQMCAMMVHEWLSRSVNNYEDQVIIVAKVVEQVFMMRHNKTKSCTGTLGFKDETFYFDIYTTENERDKLNEMILKTKKSIDSGNATFKDQRGKRYFKKK